MGMNQPTPHAFVQSIQAALEEVANPVQAVPMAKYMKNHFRFLGIPKPIRDLATKNLIRSSVFQQNGLLEVVALLWSLEEREYHYVALDVLARHAQHLTPQAWPTLERLVIEHSWWDTVDGLASSVFGPLVLNFPETRAQMDEYSRHTNFWLRRIAILHQLGYRAKTDSQRLFAYCLESAEETEFFLRKAIGWALREYAKTDTPQVLEFVQQHHDLLSSLSVREALKHQPKHQPMHQPK
jgi:3-methyladenine DNA glycosylase AlkD